MKQYLGWLMILIRGDGGQNALFKIAMNQYLGHLMILDGGRGGFAEHIAAKQCLRLLMMLDFDAYWGGGGSEHFI